MKINAFLFDFNTKNINLYSNVISVFCLINILILSPDIFDILSSQGLIKEEINNRFVYPFNPLLAWLTNPLEAIGISDNIALLTIVSIYVLALICTLSGYKKFAFSIVAWFLHLAMINSSYLFSYGADYFITSALFINIFLLIPKSKKNPEITKTIHSFIIRFTQIQMCIVYFFAGLGKSLGVDWFNGDAIWYVLNSFSPKATESFFYFFIDYPIFFIFLGWSTVILELTYPIFIYYKKTRKITLISVILLHLGIVIFMKLYTFGAIMILLNLVAWGDCFFDSRKIKDHSLFRLPKLITK